MKLDDLAKLARDIASIVTLAAMVSTAAGAVVWQMWLKDQVRMVVREELAPVNNRILSVAAATGDTLVVKTTGIYGPLPQH